MTVRLSSSTHVIRATAPLLVSFKTATTIFSCAQIYFFCTGQNISLSSSVRIHIEQIEHIVSLLGLFINLCIACSQPLTLRGLLSARAHWSLSSLIHTINLSYFLCITLSLSPCSSQASLSVLPPIFTLLNLLVSRHFLCLSTQSSPPPLRHPFITTGAVPSPALAWLHAHQTFLMLLHSAAVAATASSFPLSLLCRWLLCLSPGVVSLPSASDEPQRRRLRI